MSNELIVFISSIVCMISGCTINAFDKTHNSGLILDFAGFMAFVTSGIMLLF